MNWAALGVLFAVAAGTCGLLSGLAFKWDADEKIADARAVATKARDELSGFHTRHLTAVQRNTLIMKLRWMPRPPPPAPPLQFIVLQLDDPEARAFANEISSALAEVPVAHFLQALTVNDTNPPVYGLVLDSGPAADLLAEALESAGIAITRSSAKSFVATLTVGLRPPL